MSELTVHAWDLACATAQSPQWNDAIAAACLQGLQAAIPAEGRTDEMPFTDVAPVADDAPAVAKLAAFCGRTP